MREMPRGMKIYFPRKPVPPPRLEPIAYTHEIVPMQPVKWPKRKPGEIGDWVLKNMGWLKEEQRVVSRKKEKYKFTERGLELAKKFQRTVNEIIKQVRSYKLNIHEMYARGVRMAETYQYHNSKEFFSLVKQGSDKC